MKDLQHGRELLVTLADPDSFSLGTQPKVQNDPIHFIGPRPYAEELHRIREKTGLSSAVIWGKAEIGGNPVVLIANDRRFMLGSLGSAEVAAIIRAFEEAASEKLPVIWFALGSGARMQEGAHSLVGLSRVLGARNVLAREHLPFIAVGMNPLLGGSTVCAMQGDIILAMDDARIGYAGPRVVEMWEKFPLPVNFQEASYAYANGHVDAIVKGDTLPNTLRNLANLLAPCDSPEMDKDIGQEESFLRRDAWECVEMSRSAGKLSVPDLLSQMADGFFELHGDRISGDDPAILGGIAKIGGQPFMVIGHRSGHQMEWKIRHNLNMPHPSGHRKAIRLVRLAERLQLPILTLIDTPGVYPDVRSEAEGQGGVIGQLICAMLEVSVPRIAVILGEGAGGAALALATADRVIMTDASWYSVIPPEGAAQILWKDMEKKEEAAAALKLAPSDLLEAGIVDIVIPASPQKRDFASLLRSTVLRCFRELTG